ncbi:HD domain-containing phosphohydrolase [Solirubrobacter soli]|uniref:HD domain-containing phosphohydrolase n=1 Tax=Solirubrobacter soli TaxID=363832 RepID=UPI0003FA48E6|nr:HD domain-containing phosphohydrolase [Solirubrobacter soli]
MSEARRQAASALAAASGLVAGATLVRRARKELGESARLVEELRAEADRLKEALRKREAELVHRRELIERLQRGRRAERSWNAELRTQLQRAHESHVVVDESADARDLILRAAIELVEAQKGLLLSRADEDADGNLDLVCAHGFERDAERSAVVQRFAREVLDRDQIVREDTPGAAGDEIDNLVAIPLYLRGRFHGVIVCANRPGGFEDVDDDLLLALGDHAGTALQTERLERDLHGVHRGAVRMLIGVLDALDPVLRREAGEATLIARAVARRLDLDAHDLELIATATVLRDIGNVVVPDRILNTPGPLSADERTLVEMHPRVGAGLLDELPALHDVATAVRYHHERLDGTGYPTGLGGDAIPLAARVVAVVDAYSAMTHERPHRPARWPVDAVAELVNGAGTRFDARVVRALADVVGSSKAPSPDIAGAVASAIDTAGLPPLRELTGTDPLTLLPGHRLFHEAAARAVTGGEATVAIVQLDDLDSINCDEGYAEGDHALLIAARATQLAAARVGGTVYRDSGRRLSILIPGANGDIAAELHTEFAIGPRVTIGVAVQRPDDTGETLIARARSAITAMP